MKRVKRKWKASTLMSVCTAVIFILASLGVYSASDSLRRFKALEETSDTMAKIRGVLKDYQADMLIQRNNVLRYSVTLDSSYRDKWLKGVEESGIRESLRGELKKLGLSVEEVKLLDEIAEMQDKANLVQKEALNTENKKRTGDMSAGNIPTDKREFDELTRHISELIFTSDYTTLTRDIDTKYDTLQQAILDRVTEVRRSSQGTLKFSLMLDITILCSIFLMVLVLYFSIRRKVLNPLRALEDHFGKMAAGDIHTRAQLEEDTSEIGQLVVAANTMQDILSKMLKEVDEVLYALSQGKLKQSVNQDFVGDFVKMQESLEQIISSYSESFAEINNAAYEVSSGSEQIAMSAQGLSQGATEQAATLEELAATVNEIATRIAETLDNAENVKDAAVDMAGAVKIGNDSMLKVTETMRTLDQYSSDIYKIVKTIDNIAFQTNILALNASVEAARAEQYGASFAVVADEVRALAAQSAQSAQSTATLIESTMGVIKSGVESAGIAEDALTTIVGKADDVKARVVKITTAMESDSQAVQNTRESLEQLSTVVQANSASAEETAAASEEIAAQATAVVDLVKKFS